MILHLLNPLWLWAIAGIIIPVIIHLWHIKTGKTLKIGSIALLGDTSKQSSRSFYITDWLLLLLRCLLLILLAFLLTQPFWQKQLSPNKIKGWVLVEKQPVKEVYQHFKPTIDSLLKAGYVLHQFDTSFKAIKLEEVLKDTSRTAKTQQKPSSYWALLKMLEQQLPEKMPVYLFTSSQLQHFQGSRPALSVDLKWKTFTPRDSVSTWIQNAYLTSKDSIRLIVGNSKPTGTSFSSIKLQSTNRGNPLFNVSFEEGKLVVALKNSQQPTVLVDTSTLKISIFQDQFPADAAYLEAALQAVKKFSGRKMKIVSVSNFNQIPAKQNWIFWLSNQSFPQNKSKLVLGGNVFQYENGKAQSINSWISDAENVENAAEPINLYQHFLADKNSMAGLNTKTVWQDGFGQPVLSLQGSENAIIYRFYSHFNPAWNDLVWGSGFPKMMLNLILKSYPQPDFVLNERRVMIANQQQPSATVNPVSSFKNVKQMDLTDLKHPMWIALFLVFLLERIISSQTKKQESYG